MATLAGITSEADRKAAYDAAVAAEPTPAAQAAANQTALQQHFTRAIKGWAARTGTAAIQNDFAFREALIDSARLDTWEGELQAAGYTVTRGDSFVVSFSV